jgi:mannosyltransferase
VIEGHKQQGWQIGSQGSVTPHVAELIGVSGGLWQELFASVPAAVVVMLLALVALVAAPDARPPVIAVYALAFAIAPVVAVWIISRGPTSYWTFRYMLFSITGWAIGAGPGISFLAERAQAARGWRGCTGSRLAALRRGRGGCRGWWAWSACTTSSRSARTRRTTCGPTRRLPNNGSRSTTRRPRR